MRELVCSVVPSLTVSRYEPDLGIPISDPCYSIFDVSPNHDTK